MDADAIVVGGGLAGLVAATELIEAGKRVILLDQEPAQSLGGQAFWSFDGLFFVDSPEQRRMRIRDSHNLALQDWLGSAGFDREEDLWPICEGPSDCDPLLLAAREFGRVMVATVCQVDRVEQSFGSRLNAVKAEDLHGDENVLIRRKAWY